MEEGEVLRKWLNDNRYSAYDLARMIGVKAPSVYHQLGLKSLSKSFIDKLNTAGIDLFNKKIEESKMPAQPPPLPTDPTIDTLKFVIETQKHFIEQQKDLIDGQRDFIKTITGAGAGRSNGAPP